MTVRTYEKDGNITNCFRKVKEINVPALPHDCR